MNLEEILKIIKKRERKELIIISFILFFICIILVILKLNNILETYFSIILIGIIYILYASICFYKKIYNSLLILNIKKKDLLDEINEQLKEIKSLSLENYIILSDYIILYQDSFKIIELRNIERIFTANNTSRQVATPKREQTIIILKSKKQITCYDDYNYTFFNKLKEILKQKSINVKCKPDKLILLKIFAKSILYTFIFFAIIWILTCFME